MDRSFLQFFRMLNRSVGVLVVLIFVLEADGPGHAGLLIGLVTGISFLVLTYAAIVFLGHPARCGDEQSI